MNKQLPVKIATEMKAIGENQEIYIMSLIS